MKKRDILKLIFKKKTSKWIKKEENQLIRNHDNWVELDKTEKKEIDKQNLNINKLMKNIYVDYDKCDKKMFVSDLYYQTKLLPRLNNINYDKYGILFKNSYFTDKNYQEKMASMFKFPDCIIRCIDGDYYDKNFNYITKKKALDLLNNYDKLVFKKSLGDGHGRGVSLKLKDEFKDEINNFGDNFVVQKIVKQHKFLSYFNETSVNIIRITSVLIRGEVYILSGILRIGAPGSFCDHLGFKEESPRIIGLDENGKLKPFCVDPDKVIVYQDVFGKKIIGAVPFYNKIKKMVCKQHMQFIHHKIIGWDITIDNNDEIICIEYNSNIPGIIQSQMVCGPIFALKIHDCESLLDEILKE